MSFAIYREQHNHKCITNMFVPLDLPFTQYMSGWI